MKKKKVYTNKITSDIGNNQDYCEVEEKMVVPRDNQTIEDKLDQLFNTNGYVFNINVKIVTNDKTYDTKVASRVGNNIITLDNDVINIADIKDIVF